MKLHLLNGFLASGKTTAIRNACTELISKGQKVGVITNDQGIKLVDGDFFKSLNIPGRQVVNGCFCCNYDQFELNMDSLVRATNPDVIFAESVGSCTDIVATVLKPLQKFHPEFALTFSVFADIRLLRMLLKQNLSMFDESVNYIYQKQLEEASIIVVNKVDLVTREEIDETRIMIEKKFPGKKLLLQNSLDKNSIASWLAQLDENIFDHASPSLQLDYEIYGAGEAKLAWVDREITIQSVSGRARQEAADLINKIYERLQRAGYPIGHLKFLLDGEEKFSFASIRDDRFIPKHREPASEISVLMNARVQTEPQVLSKLIDDVSKELMDETECKIEINSVAAFQPGFPRPTHRLV